jgi:hypothetical protein
MKTTGKYILKGKKVYECKELLEWSNWFEKTSKTKERVVKQNMLPNGFYVSTVFLGLDHNFSGNFSGKGKPLIFETMVFDDLFKADSRSLDEEMYQDRYSTWDEAMTGHIKTKRQYQYKNLTRIPLYLFVRLVRVFIKLERGIYGKFRRINKRA